MIYLPWIITDTAHIADGAKWLFELGFGADYCGGAF